MEALIAEEDSKAEKLAAEYKIKKKTYDLLPNAEKNIVQLKEISIQSAKHLLELAAEWEKHRIPKIEEYRKLKDALANLEVFNFFFCFFQEIATIFDSFFSNNREKKEKLLSKLKNFEKRSNS